MICERIVFAFMAIALATFPFGSALDFNDMVVNRHGKNVTLKVSQTSRQNRTHTLIHPDSEFCMDSACNVIGTVGDFRSKVESGEVKLPFPVKYVPPEIVEKNKQIFKRQKPAKRANPVWGRAEMERFMNTTRNGKSSGRRLQREIALDPFVQIVACSTAVDCTLCHGYWASDLSVGTAGHCILDVQTDFTYTISWVYLYSMGKYTGIQCVPLSSWFYDTYWNPAWDGGEYYFDGQDADTLMPLDCDYFHYNADISQGCSNPVVYSVNNDEIVSQGGIIETWVVDFLAEEDVVATPVGFTKYGMSGGALMTNNGILCGHIQGVEYSRRDVGLSFRHTNMYPPQ